MARRLLNKVSNELNPEPTRHEVNTDDSINHTVEWTWMQDPSQMHTSQDDHSSTRVEQKTVESGGEEIGSSMRIIVLNMLRVETIRPCNVGETIATESSGVLQNTAPEVFEDWISRRAAEYGAWQFSKFNGVFREAELIHLECYHLEIHLYQLFFELVCSTDIVWSCYIIWSVVWFRALCCVIGSWMFTLLVEPMHNYLLNSFSMDMASRLAIMVSCWYFWTVRSYSWIRFSFIYNYFLERTK